MTKNPKTNNVRGASIHFRTDKPLPVIVVKKLVKARIEETK